MNSQELGGVVRVLLSALGGYFAGQGYIDGELAQALAGAAATVVVAGWSVHSKRRAKR